MQDRAKQRGPVFVLSFIGTALGVTRHVPMRHNAARAKSGQLQFCHEMTMAMRFGKMTR